VRRVRAFLRKLAALAQEWVDPSAAKLPKLEEWDVDAVRAFVARARSLALDPPTRNQHMKSAQRRPFFVLWGRHAPLY
jgi:hypothetical protein